MTIRNVELIRQASSFNGKLLTRAEIDVLWQQANEAMHSGAYQEAFATVESLLCQADRDGGITPSDVLPDPMATTIGKGKLEMIQGFLDRVQSLNFYIRHN